MKFRLTGLATLLDNLGDSRFWTVSPGTSKLVSEISRLIAEVCYFL